MDPPSRVPAVSEQRMWAPWRLDYIQGPKRGGCIFCDKPSEGDDEATHIVHRGELCFVILNAFPYNNGHVMLAPFRHVGSIEELTPEELAEMMALAQRTQVAVRAAYRPEGFNLGINEGKVAGAGVEDHIHLHLVPRWGGDTNFMPVIADTRVLPQSLEASYAAVREGFVAAEARA